MGETNTSHVATGNLILALPAGTQHPTHPSSLNQSQEGIRREAGDNLEGSEGQFSLEHVRRPELDSNPEPSQPKVTHEAGFAEECCGINKANNRGEEQKDIATLQVVRTLGNKRYCPEHRRQLQVLMTSLIGFGFSCIRLRPFFALFERS